MLAIDSLAYKSKISNINPRAKLFFALGPLIVVLGFGRVRVSLACILVMSLGSLRFSNLGVKKYIGLMAIPLVFLLMGTVTIMFGRYKLGSDLVVGFNSSKYAYGVSGEALVFGMALVLRALACVSCMYFISINTPMVQLFGVLRSWKVPVLIVSLMELIYRYIFVVLEEADRVFVAQSSRGIGYSFSSRIRAFGELVGSLLQRSLGRCDKIVSALEARGYDGNFYVLEEKFVSGTRFFVMGWVVTGFLVVLGLWR